MRSWKRFWRGWSWYFPLLAITFAAMGIALGYFGDPWFSILVSLAAMVAVVARLAFFQAEGIAYLFQADHVMEMAKVLAELKARGGWGQKQSSRGVSIASTIRQDDSRHIHHISVGMSGRVFPQKAGRALVICVCRLLGMPLEQTAFAISDRSSYHARLVLTEAQNRDYLSAHVKQLTMQEAGQEREHCLSLLPKIAFTNLADGREEEL